MPLVSHTFISSFILYCTSCSLFTVAGNAIISSTQLPWFSLAKSTAEQGRQIINWPEADPETTPCIVPAD